MTSSSGADVRPKTRQRGHDLVCCPGNCLSTDYIRLQGKCLYFRKHGRLSGCKGDARRGLHPSSGAHSRPSPTLIPFVTSVPSRLLSVGSEMSRGGPERDAPGSWSARSATVACPSQNRQAHVRLFRGQLHSGSGTFFMVYLSNSSASCRYRPQRQSICNSE